MCAMGDAPSVFGRYSSPGMEKDLSVVYRADHSTSQSGYREPAEVNVS